MFYITGDISAWGIIHSWRKKLLNLISQAYNNTCSHNVLFLQRHPWALERICLGMLWNVSPSLHCFWRQAQQVRSLNASPVRASWDRHYRQERAVKLNSKMFKDFENLLVPWFWSVFGKGKTPPPDSGINNIFCTHRQILPRDESSGYHASQPIWVIFNKFNFLRYYSLGVMHKNF